MFVLNVSHSKFEKFTAARHNRVSFPGNPSLFDDEQHIRRGGGVGGALEGKGGGLFDSSSGFCGTACQPEFRGYAYVRGV